MVTKKRTSGKRSAPPKAERLSLEDRVMVLEARVAVLTDVIGDHTRLLRLRWDGPDYFLPEHMRTRNP